MFFEKTNCAKNVNMSASERRIPKILFKMSDWPIKKTNVKIK